MADNTRAHTIGATMYSVSFTNIYTAEKMIYLPIQFVFSEDELKDGFEALIKKYKLNPYYRDIKLAKKEDLPKKFPLDVLKFNDEGFCELISLRAMHRICVSELFTKDIHFLFNKYLKEKMFTYDNEHGCIVKTRLNRKMVPVKFNVAIYSGEKDVIQRNAMHIECVTDNEGRSGFLLYYLANDFIDSIYLDGKEVKNITIIPNDYSEQ